ncbi:MAG: fibronectin type III domain-containing protein [Bacteroidota bacterium]
MRTCLVLVVLLLAGCAGPQPRTDESPRTEPPEVTPPSATTVLENLIVDTDAFSFPRGTALDTLVVTDDGIDVRFNATLAHRPFRPDDVDALHSLVRDALAPFFPDAPIRLWVGRYDVAELVPNAYRDVADLDSTRLAKSMDRPAPLVTNASRPWVPEAGLEGRHIALWPSHGWYYEPSLDRWEWQRARLFQTVEDLLPYAFIERYIAPMLERAGATVLMPRERDPQPRMAIVDGDSPDAPFEFVGEWYAETPGFAHQPPYEPGDNPFTLGSHRVSRTATADLRIARWRVPAVADDFAVYVSYQHAPDRATSAAYTVRHAGGKTRFAVNQQIGGGTWLYLGTFRFSGDDREGVTLSANASAGGATVSADAVRFGGGMGDVSRGGAPSGRPRFVEAARYYQQFAGAPEYVYNVTGEPDADYRDDYQSRGEWVNWLRAPVDGNQAPAVGDMADGYGPVGHRNAPGLGIPVDLALGFHTDAGQTQTDSTIGTLMIVNTNGLDSTWTFPDGVRRIANRDLGDLMQTQLVDDLRARYDGGWTRRGLWDRRYSEATRPNVPSALLELLSHHNFADVRFAQDPRFRRDASRAIYKSILRFLAVQHGFDPVVQPLAPSHFAASLGDSSGVTLRWRAVSDPLEPTAEPEAYIVYTRAGDPDTSGWDNGQLVRDTKLTLTGLEPGVLHSYRVAAVNAGGESAPSEAVAVLHVADSLATGPPVLVVNGFTRIAPPISFVADTLAGFMRSQDAGVADGVDVHTIGAQHNFDRTRPWTDDDDPGHGASYDDLATTVLPGNTFDFVAVHGAALREAGRSFASSSADAFAAGLVDTDGFATLDLILGEQKTTPWPVAFRPPEQPRTLQYEALPLALRTALTGFCEAGGDLFVSGAYVGSDTAPGQPADAPGPAFLRETLGVRWRTDHAATTGGLVAPNGRLLPKRTRLDFVADHDPADLRPPIYAVEAPDALEPADSLGTTVLRYNESTMSAGVAHRGPSCAAVTLGVPFETLATPTERATLMRAVLRFFEE